MASFVSRVYALLPRISNEGREKFNKEHGVWFRNLKNPPSVSECEQFEIILKKKIITLFSQNAADYSMMLSVEYVPEEILREAFDSVFEDKYRFELGSFFPQKSCTRISFNAKKAKLCLQINFVGPLF